MAVRGRKPKPTALKKLAGYPGHRPLNKFEPVPAPAIPKCPAFLSGPERTEWNRVTKQLLELGLLAEIDRSLLAIYCMQWGTFLEASAQLKKKGRLTILTGTGSYMQDPLVGVRNQAAQQVVKIAELFGISPSARARVHADPIADHKTLAEELFSGAFDAPSERKKRSAKKS
jgi:P27 family predicted phage terminase small subunit